MVGGVDVVVIGDVILTIGAGSVASLSIVMMPETAAGTGGGHGTDGGMIVSGDEDPDNGTRTITTSASIGDVIVGAISTATASGPPASEGSTGTTAILTATASGLPPNEGSPATAISSATTTGEIINEGLFTTTDLAGDGNAALRLV